MALLGEGSVLLLNRSQIVLVILVGLAVLLPWLAMAVGTLEAGRTVLAPEVERRVETVGRGAVQSIDHALSLGIPLADLNGVEAFFGEMFVHNPEVAWIAIVNTSGTVVHVAGAAGAVGDAAAPPVGASLSGDPNAVVLPLKAHDVEAGQLVLRWSVAGEATVMARSLAAMTVVLMAGLVAAWEISRALWGVGVEASALAVDRFVRRILKGDLTGAIPVAGQDVLGRLGGEVTRLTRLVNYRSEELQALAQDVARVVPAEDAQTVRDIATNSVAGLKLAPEEAVPAPGLRQMPLTRFVMFCVGLALALPLLVLLDGLSSPAPPSAWMWSGAATLLPAVLLSRYSGLAVVPGRLLASIGMIMVEVALQGLIVPWAVAAPVNGLILGVGLGFLMQPLRLACIGEGRTHEEVGQQTALGMISGLLVGTGLGAILMSLVPEPPVNSLAGLMMLSALGAVLLWYSPPPRSSVSEAAWPNPQEIAAVAGRWQLALLTLMVAVPVRILMMLVVVVLLPSVLLGMDNNMVDLAWVSMLLPTCLVLGWKAAGWVRGGRPPYMVMGGVALVSGMLAPLVTPDRPVLALLSLAVLLLAGGAAANVRQRAAREAAIISGHGIGHGRYERVVSFFETLSMVAALMLAGMVGDAHGAGMALVETSALVVLIGTLAAVVLLLPQAKRIQTDEAPVGGRS